MAISQDASTPAAVTGIATTGTTLTTASFSPPARAMLAVLVSWVYSAAGGTPAFTISDSVSGSYTAGPAVYDAVADQASIFTRYLSSAPGSMTLTVTVGSGVISHGWILAVHVLNGAAASQAGAGSNAAFNNGNVTASSGSITTTKANSWVLISCAVGWAESTITPVTNTTTLTSTVDATVNGTLLTGQQASSTATPGATTLGWTVGTATCYAWAALEILPDTGPLSMVGGSYQTLIG